MKIADGIHRLGDGLVNSYLLGEGSEVTIIDAAMPGYWSDLPAELAAMGRTLDDVRATGSAHALACIGFRGETAQPFCNGGDIPRWSEEA